MRELSLRLTQVFNKGLGKPVWLRLVGHLLPFTWAESGLEMGDLTFSSLVQHLATG